MYKKINKKINIGKYIYGKYILVSIYVYMYVCMYASVLYPEIFLGIPVRMSNSVRLKD